MPSKFFLLWLVLLLAACGALPQRQARPAVSETGNEVALYALGLIDTGYRFGGKNPDAGSTAAAWCRISIARPQA